ncbi:PAS domain-containing protein [bacterium]|nr:PAS domain-containing protein [bacterium]
MEQKVNIAIYHPDIPIPGDITDGLKSIGEIEEIPTIDSLPAGFKGVLLIFTREDNLPLNDVKRISSNNDIEVIIVCPGIPEKQKLYQLGVFAVIDSTVPEEIIHTAANAGRLARSTEGSIISKDPGLQERCDAIEKLLEDASRELVEKNRFLMGIVDNIPVGIVSLDPNGRITYVSCAFESLFSTPRNKLLDREIDTLSDVMEQDISTVFQEVLETHRLKAETIEDSQRRILSIRWIPILEGELLQNILLLVEDTTAQIRYKQWIETILESLGDAVCILDREKKVVWANQKMKELFGYHSEIIGADCKEVFKCEKDCENCPLFAPFIDQKTHHGTREYTTTEGDKKFLDLTAAGMKPVGDMAQQVVAVIKDVTERENLYNDVASAKENLAIINRSLNEKLSQMRMIIELSDTLQVTSDLDEILHIILTAVTAQQGLGFNRAFLVLHNPETGRLEGRFAVGPSDPEEAGRIWHQLKDDGASLREILSLYKYEEEKHRLGINNTVKKITCQLSQDDNVLVRAFKTRTPYLVTDAANDPLVPREMYELLGADSFAVIPLGSKDTTYGLLLADNIITKAPIEQKQLNLLKVAANHASLAIERYYLGEKLAEKIKELKKATKALMENQEKLINAERLSAIGQMAAQIAHEIRHPLSTIGGMAQTCLKRFDPSDPLYERIKIIVDESKRLENIVNNVLDFSRARHPNIQETDVNEVLHSIIGAISMEAIKSNIIIRENLDETLPLIEADKDQLFQVFLNLVKNAISAMPKGGKLEITTRKDVSNVWVEVSDTGIGIAPENVDKIFKPFFTTKSTGIGLGLPITYQIINNHHGSIWFTTQEGKRTTFYVKLPIKQPKGGDNGEATSGGG